MAEAVFPNVPLRRGMYESFFLRAVSPDEPVGLWLRYTVHKRPGAPARGSVWCTVFDASRRAPFVHKETTTELAVPPGAWIAVGDARIGRDGAAGSCGDARWSLRLDSGEGELRHFAPPLLYRLPVPRTKLTSPLPAASFDGTLELADRTVELRRWHGMVGHNWGAEHAERWIWLHGLDFAEDAAAWIDVGLARVRVAGRLTPWLAAGALSLGGRRLRLGGFGARGTSVSEDVLGCSLTLPGEDGSRVEARVEVPPGTAAGWRYADPGGGEHDVVNCSLASLVLEVRPRGASAAALRTAHGAAYELGMRERDHGVPMAPFADG